MVGMGMYDVVVVGGGPSGLSAAVECSGVKTLLVERDDIDIHKKSWLVSNHSIQDFDLKGVAHPIKKDREIFRDIDLTIDCDNYRYTIDQSRFNRLMLKRGNFDCESNTQIIDAHRDNGITVLESADGREFQARLVIDATGAGACVARMLGMDIKWRLGNMAYACTIKGDFDEDTSILNGVMLTTKFGPRMGEFYIYPYGDRVDVGIGHFLFPRDIKELLQSGENEKEVIKKHLRDRLAQMAGQYIEFRDEDIAGDFLGIGKSTMVPNPFSDGLLLSGEATGLVQPGYQYGFETALYTGKICGKLAAEATRSGNTTKSFLRRYNRMLSANERYGYLYGSLLRESIMLGCGVLGEDVMYACYAALREIYERYDTETLYRFLDERRMGIGELLPLISIGGKKLFKYCVPAIKDWKFSNLCSYLSDRFF